MGNIDPYAWSVNTDPGSLTVLHIFRLMNLHQDGVATVHIRMGLFTNHAGSSI